MNRTLSVIAASAFVGLSACTDPAAQLDLPPRQDPLPEFTQDEARNVMATTNFMMCLVDQGGAALINSPWFDDLLAFCAEQTDLSEAMLYDVLDKFQNEYGENWPYMVEELFSEQNALAFYINP